MLTEQDIEQIEEVIEDKIKDLPTKDEMFTRMDAIMGELKAIREEMIIVSHKALKNTDRIESIENIHPQGKHASL